MIKLFSILLISLAISCDRLRVGWNSVFGETAVTRRGLRREILRFSRVHGPDTELDALQGCSCAGSYVCIFRKPVLGSNANRCQLITNVQSRLNALNIQNFSHQFVVIFDILRWLLHCLPRFVGFSIDVDGISSEFRDSSSRKCYTLLQSSLISRKL